MSEKDRKRFDVSPEDAARMIRLSEEVRARLEEMALIFTRTVGIPLTPDMVRKYSPHGPGAAFHAAGADIELVCTSDGVCGCFDYRDGPNPRFEFPCGTPPP
jgi:hypothetical protein